MKYSWPRVLTTFAGATIVLVAASARLMASPPQMPAETVHVKPVAGDQHAAASRAVPARDSEMMVAVAVPSRLVEYTIRQRRGVGRFITDSVLQAERALPLGTVLRKHLLGIGRALDAQRAATTNIDNRCRLDVFVNGTRSTDPLDAIGTGTLAGVEYYDRFNVPGQYQRAAPQCEALLLWTR
ncbi:MAG: hypothetical protein JWM41_4588 [Gemmatimonadetes bacterium]|nr:hypothetical protein [Gemmatimonadota bacterium]